MQGSDLNNSVHIHYINKFISVYMCVYVYTCICYIQAQVKDKSNEDQLNHNFLQM